jgi:restriction endonuclease S subunit
LQDIYANPITYSNFCKKLRAETPAYAIYAERLLESIYINGEMRQFFTGTSIPNLDIQSLLAYKIIIPKAEILEEYYKKIGKGKFSFLFNPENIYLTQIRDALLPRLMSGEIEV